MPTDPNKKYLERPVDVTQAGLQNILNAGSEESDQKSFSADMTKMALSVSGPDTSNTPAVLMENGLNDAATTQGLSSLQAEKKAAASGYTEQREKLSTITQNAQDVMGMQEYYNESGALQGAASNMLSGAKMGGKVVHDVVSAGILKGGYFNSIANSIQEEDWRSRANSAKETGDESYKVFKERMGIYHEGDENNPSSFFGFASLGGDPSVFANLKSDNIRVIEDDGTARIPTADEMAWFERYRNLNRSRVADRNSENLRNAFNQEMADYSTWIDEEADTRGNKYTKARAASNIIGAGVGSGLLFELAAAPAGVVNFAGQAIRAKGVVKAATTANKAWRGSVLTNPYFLSQGGGVYASSTGATFSFAGAFMQQYTETKAQALAAGWDPVTAGRIAAKNAGLQAVVESVGYERFLHKYLMQGNAFEGFFTNAFMSEGLEEVAQTGIDTYFTNKYGMDYTTAKELAGNMWISFLGGAAGAGAIGAIHLTTNVGGSLLTGDYKLRNQISDQNVSTKEWLKQIGVDTSAANTKENTQNILQNRPDYLNKFREYVDNQKRQNAEAESVQQAGQQGSEQTTPQLTYNINYDWAPTVITSMSNGKKMAFNEFCREHNVDANNHEELREALLMWTGNENLKIEENPQSEDPQLDKAMAELNAVAKTLSSDEFQLEQPGIAEDLKKTEREQILAAVKQDVYRRAKQENPKITKAQLDAIWQGVSKMFSDDLDSGELTTAVANEAMEQVAIVAQDARLAAATKEATMRAAKKTQNVIDTTALRLAITGKGTEKYNAQWDVAQQILENRIVQAFGNRKLAKAISTLIRKTYYKSLLNTPEVNPVTFVSKAAPDFITQAALRRNNIRIAGLEGLEGKIQQLGVNDTIEYAKSVNGILAKQIEQYKKMEDGQEKNELANSILYGLFGEDAGDIDIEDALAFIDTVTREELKLHKSIGSGKVVSNFSESDFTLLALLRLRGATETEIFQAFGITDTNTLEQLEEYYQAAVQAYYPAPTAPQRAALEGLGAQVRGENAVGEVTGSTQQTSTGESLVFVTDEEVGETVTHEVAHWIEVLSKQVAEYAETQTLMALGQRQVMSLGETSDNNLPFSNRSIASLYTRFVEVLSQREDTKNLTPREISETFAEFLTRYLVQYNDIDPELAAGFQGIYDARPANDNVVGSAYNKLTQAQKTAIRKILDETFDTQVTEHAQMQIQEGEGLREALMKSLAAVDKSSATESDAYQLYKALTGYISSRPNTSGILNRGMSKMVKAYGAFKQTGNNNVLKGALVSIALETINQLEADGQKALVGLMYEQAQIAEEPGFMTDAERLSQRQRAEEKEIKGLEEDEEGKDWLDRILEKNDAQGGEAYFSRRQDDGRSVTEKMRGNPTLKENIRETFKAFRLKGFKDAFNSLTASVVEYANKIHPMLGAAIRAACYEINEMKTYNAEITERWYNTFEEYNEWAVKNGQLPITNNEFEIYKNYLINHKRNAAFEFMEQKMAANPDMRAQLHGMHMVLSARLDECYKLMLQMGFQLEEVQDYFPSIVKDREEYAMQTYRDILEAERRTGKKIMPDWQRSLKGKYETEIRKAIRKKLKSGEDVNIVDVVNAVNAELGHPDDKLSAQHLYKVQNMNKPMKYNRMYMDVFDAFTMYTNDVANKFLNYRLVGKAKAIKDENGRMKLSDESGIIGSILTGLQLSNIEGYVYDPEIESAFVKALDQTLSRKDQGNDIWKTLKQVQTYMTLGRLTSAFNQFLELAPTMMRYGLVPSIKSMFQALSKENPLTINTLGIQPLNEVQKLDSNGALGQLNTFMLKANGFTKADILMKNTVIVATLTNAQQMLARDEEYGNENETYGQRRFHRSFDETFPSPAYNDERKAQIKADLKAGNLTPDVKLFLRNALAATQPIDLAEVPALYNSLGNFGRSMYFLSVVSIKQMRFIWDEFVKDYRNGGVKDAAINMSRFLWFACLAGVPPDWLKDIVHGKQPNIRETAFYSPLQYFMINKYFTSVLKDKGIATAVGMRFSVGVQFGDDIVRAILNKEPWYLAKSVPFAGELLDHYYGVAHKQAVRHKENINKYEPVSSQLIKKPLQKHFDFFGWKI